MADGVCTAVVAGIKTSRLFFAKGKLSEKTWSYDLSEIKVGKKALVDADRFWDFCRVLLTFGDSEYSSTVACAETEASTYRLKTDNLHAKPCENHSHAGRVAWVIPSTGNKVAKAGRLRALPSYISHQALMHYSKLTLHCPQPNE